MRLRMTCVALILLAACRTTRPPDAEAIPPLSASSPAEAARQLADRRAQFRGQRSFIRLKLGRLSARGQLQIDSGGRMLMTMYSPVGTTVAQLYAEGDDVIFLNDFDGTVSRGKAADFGALGGQTALLLVGLPPAGVESITYGAAGIENVNLAGATVRFDPPVYPPKRVTIDQGSRHVEIEHLESFVDTATLTPPEIPSSYRCCVPPPL
jgi:hypothetical protein